MAEARTPDGNLVLTSKGGEQIVLKTSDGDVRIVAWIDSDRVKLRISAPQAVQIQRRKVGA